MVQSIRLFQLPVFFAQIRADIMHYGSYCKAKPHYFILYPRNRMTSVPSKRTVRSVLIDLSGTLHVGDTALPGAVSAMEKLLSTTSLNVLCLTNTTTVSLKTLYERLVTNMRFPPTLEIHTSAGAAVRYVREHDLHPFCIVEDDMEQGDLQEISTCGDDCDSVLIGLAPSKLNYNTLNEAFRILQRYPPDSGASTKRRLLAFHCSKHLRDTDNLLSLGPGGFIKCLEHTTGHLAHVLGKPSPDFYRAALAKLDAAACPEECIMIGDDYRNDILGAHEAGISRAILVQTGKYQHGDEVNLVSEQIGGSLIVLPSIVEAVEFVLENAVINE